MITSTKGELGPEQELTMAFPAMDDAYMQNTGTAEVHLRKAVYLDGYERNMPVHGPYSSDSHQMYGFQSGVAGKGKLGLFGHSCYELDGLYNKRHPIAGACPAPVPRTVNARRVPHLTHPRLCA